MDGLYTMCEWLVRFVYLNVLWFLFTVLGLGIFGILPATIAVFTITRKWIIGDSTIHISKLFWKTYKAEFIKGNILGLVFAVIGSILYVDFIFVFVVENSFADYLFFPLTMMALVYVLTFLHVFPLYVHYDITVMQTIKNAFFIMVINPISSFLILLSIISIFFLNVSFPALIPFISLNVLSWIIMFFANHSFVKIQKKYNLSKKDVVLN